LILDAEFPPQLGGKCDPALGVHLRLGAEIVSDECHCLREGGVVVVTVKELFVLPPCFHGVYLGRAAIETGDEQLLFHKPAEILLERGRKLDSPLIVEPAGVHPPRGFRYCRRLLFLSIHFWSRIWPNLI
jgi:hypothetical protein